VQILCFVGQAFVIAIIARIILSWFYPFRDGSPWETIYSFVFAVTEPVLGPIRRALPMVRAGNMALDLSPIIVLFFFELVVFRFIC
jgi:YggT family protein